MVYPSLCFSKRHGLNLIRAGKDTRLKHPISSTLKEGHAIFWFAGNLDRPPQYAFPVPQAHFHHPANEQITRQAYGQTRRSGALTEEIHAQRTFLKTKLHQFIKKFGINVLIVENAFSLPMHIPLGLALTETIAEIQMPTIARHSGFYWERSRYAVNAVGDYFHMAFPPQPAQNDSCSDQYDGT